MKFKIGYMVIFKSGGPDMLIIRYDEDGYFCIWNAGARISGAYFIEETLKLVK